MQNARYKRYSINLDDDSHDQCGMLATDMTVSISGMIRMLIREAFAARYINNYGKQDDSRSCLTTT